MVMTEGFRRRALVSFQRTNEIHKIVRRDLIHVAPAKMQIEFFLMMFWFSVLTDVLWAVGRKAVKDVSSVVMRDF